MVDAPTRRATLFATVAAAGIVQLPTAAVVVALPTIHDQFNTSMAELQWTVTAFYIPFAAFLIVAGRAADVFGRRRMLLGGSALFAAGSALAMAAPGAELLIAGIALSGCGGALLMPSSMSILTNVFTGEGRGFAIGMWGAATELISGVGVVVGGVLTGDLSWRWIFGVDVLVAAAIALLAILWVPESRDPNASRRLDLAGAALSVTALTSLTLALIQGAAWGWGSLSIVALLVAAVALFAAFFVVERRAAEPLLDLSFFRHRNFSGATTSIFVIDFSFGALLFFLPLYFQEILDYSPIETGVLLLPLTGLMVVASPLGGRIAARTGPRPPIVAGLLAMAVAIFWISGLDLSTTYSELWLPTAIMGFGIGLALTPMNLAAMNAVSRDHAGAAAGVLVTLSGLGATLGVAVTGALFQELQTQRTVTLVGEAGASVSRGQAQELAGVLAGSSSGEKTLESIAGGHPHAVEEALREAFVSALGTSLEVSAALVLAGAVLAIVLLRRSSPADAAAVDHPAPSATPRPAPLGAPPPASAAT
ncbi:MAG TPA: MFS transporter [Solirubrobacterales bacterium]|nr:MFS transporter [Solirubrobacterales bacterium]